MNVPLALPEEHRRRQRRRLLLRLLGGFLLAALLAYMAWPYWVLWQLDRAVVSGDPGALRRLVDLPRVRRAIERRLDKDQRSDIGELSNSFIEWLQAGLNRLGDQAVERLVDMEWVRGQLLRHASGPGDGFLYHVRYAFFDSPTDFRVRVEGPERPPVYFRLHLEDGRWRLTTLYG